VGLPVKEDPPAARRLSVTGETARTEAGQVREALELAVTFLDVGAQSIALDGGGGRLGRLGFALGQG